MTAQRHTDDEITETMVRFGGGFVAHLGRLFRFADPANQQRLKRAFPEYWQRYDELAAFSDKARPEP